MTATRPSGAPYGPEGTGNGSEAGPEGDGPPQGDTAPRSHADPALVSNYEDRRAAARDRAAVRKRLAAERPPCRCETIHGHCYAAECPCPIHAEEVGAL